jgi:Flp pilus assembly protein TadG
MSIVVPNQGALTRARRRVGRSERGQSLAELGILLPVLTLLLVVAVDFGRLYHSYVSVSNAARTGAQYASASSANSTNTAGITSAVNQDAGGLQGNATVTSSTGTDNSGNTYVSVTVSYQFNTLFDWVGLPASIPLSRTVRMRVLP